MSRLTHVISTSGGIGGAEKVLLALLEAGEQRGWEQRVIKIGPRDERFDLPVSQLAELNHLPSGKRGSARALRLLRQRLTAEDPGIVQAMLPEAAVLVALHSSLTSERRPTILSHQHGDHFIANRRPVAARLDRWAGSRFDRIVACSDATASFLTTVYRYPKSAVESIPNGWSGSPKPRAPSGSPRVICVARLRPQKNHALLLAAFSECLSVRPEARLILCGDGPEEATLRGQADELGIAGSVEFLGATDDVWQQLAAADLFAIASDYEPLGIAALEALAAGVPVVATRVGGLPEVVGDCGILTAPGSRAELARAMGDLLADDESRLRLGTLGAERAANSTAEAMAASYFDLYNSIRV